MLFFVSRHQRRPSVSHLDEPADFAELLQDPEADLSRVNALPSTDAFIEFLRRRALDDSVYVRRYALQVLENILKFTYSRSGH